MTDEKQQDRLPASPSVIAPAARQAAPTRRPTGAHRRTPPHGLQGNAAIVALAAGATISAASALSSGGNGLVAGPSDNEQVVLLASDEDPNAHPAPETAGQPSERYPGTPVAKTDEPVETGSVGQADAEAAFTAALEAGAKLDHERQIAEEQARRPSVALPAVGDFTSGFGPRWGTFHAGIDIANAIGTPIFAATDGVVIDSGPASGYGNWIRIMSPDGVMTVYGHNDSNEVEVGDQVVAGQQIARMGNEGFSTGPHLHFEVWVDNGARVIDPKPWLAENGISLSDSIDTSVEEALPNSSLGGNNFAGTGGN